MPTEFVTAKHHLTDREKQKIGMTVAEALAQVADLKEQFDSVKKDFTSRIKIAELTASVEAAKIRNGYEMRDVECTVDINPKTRRVDYVSLVDGKLVESRPATQDELQRKMFEDEENANWPAPEKTGA